MMLLVMQDVVPRHLLSFKPTQNVCSFAKRRL